MRLVVALGGNALLRPEQKGTYSEQVENVRTACAEIGKMIEAGHQVILTHGNGPQVGDLAVQQAATAEVPENPLNVLGAMTQGEIGYLIQRELGNQLRKTGSKGIVVSLITQTVVSAEDPSFDNPTKPIGPFYTEEQAKKVGQEKGFVIRKVTRRGERQYRRVVASPDPIGIVEADVISAMVKEGFTVVAAGGGGIPVVNTNSGFDGVEAVIDKDLAAEKLAENVGADGLLILTNVDAVEVDYGTPKEHKISKLKVSDAKKLMSEGQFPAGSMGPKVLACVRFVEQGGKLAVISNLVQARDAIGGRAGTSIVPG